MSYEYNDLSIQTTGYLFTAHDYNTLANNDKAIYRQPLYLQVEIYPDGLDVETGDGAFYFHIPPRFDGMELNYFHAEHLTPGGGGTDTLIQVHNVTDGVDLLRTRLQIDSGEEGSDTASTAYDIDETNAALATNDILRVDIDQLDSSTVPEGLIFTMGAAFS